MKEILGWHYFLDFQVTSNKDVLSSAEKLRSIFLHFASIGKVKIIGEFFYPFPNGGVSGVILIEESHITIHTWPEYNFVSIDIYFCDPKVDIDNMIEEIKNFFQPINLCLKFFARGF